MEQVAVSSVRQAMVVHMGQVAVCDRPWWDTWGRWQCVTGHGGTHGAGGSV